MLTEKRWNLILHHLNERGSITVTELTELLGASESTIRRDLNTLDKDGKLNKVFGGAVVRETSHTTYEPSFSQKIDANQKEKKLIAKYAAGLIAPEDFVYIDAGTSTAYMIPYITENRATFITNGIQHAQTLAKSGLKVILIGGELKDTTEAVVGSQALANVQEYHFTKAFMGTNGVTKKEGFTTPDFNEASVKKVAMIQARDSYILCDHTKFGIISSVTFSPFGDAFIITDQDPSGQYKGCKNIIIVKN